MTGRVLVVDDTPLNAALLEALLTGEYYDVVIARDGPSALEIVHTAMPDIVLLDVMMPGMDGFEVCRRMKADVKVAHIPIVMVTALSDKADLVRGLEAGADDFLTKPVNHVILSARVRSLLRLKMLMDEWRLREETRTRLDAVSHSDMPARPSAGRILVVEDKPAIAQTIIGELEQADHRPVLFNAAAPALERARSGEFELAIVSMTLRETDSLRLCSQFLSNEATRHMPILLVIEQPDTNNLVRGLELGISDYLTRPVHRAELLARVNTQITRRRYQDRLRAAFYESVTLAVTDSLTGLYNRRYFEAHLEATLRRAAEAGKPTSLAMVDIDLFKVVNDTHGHAVGDEVLRNVALRLADDLRTSDLVARIGGEEFVVIFPDADGELAMAVAERMRRAVADRPIPVSGMADGLNITASFGLATSQPGQFAAADLLQRADAALYRAKHAGRNRVMLNGGPEIGAVA